VQLTPVARAEGRAFGDTVFGDNPRHVNYDYVPSAVFARPEAASVGMTETKAREKLGGSVQGHRSNVEPLFHSITEQDEQVMLKLVVDGNGDRVLGAHMVGENAGAICQFFVNKLVLVFLILAKGTH